MFCSLIMFRWLVMFQIKYTYGSTENMELARSYYAQAIKLCPNNIRALYGLFLVMPPCFGWSSGLPALSYFCDRLLWLHCFVFCFHPWSCGLPALSSVFITDPIASLPCLLSSSLILWLPCLHHWSCGFPALSSYWSLILWPPCHTIHLSSPLILWPPYLVIFFITDSVASLPYHLSS